MSKKNREVGTCLSVEELSGLYDRAIGGKPAERMRDHLARCPKCAQEFKVLTRLMTGIEDRPPPKELISQAIGRPRATPASSPRRRAASRLSLR